MSHVTITLDTSVDPLTLQYTPSDQVHHGDTVSFLLASGCTHAALVTFESPSCFDSPPEELRVTSDTVAAPSPALTVSTSASYANPYFFDVAGPGRESLKGELDVVPPTPPKDHA